jgi:hypothetical protein
MKYPESFIERRISLSTKLAGNFVRIFMENQNVVLFQLVANHGFDISPVSKPECHLGVMKRRRGTPEKLFGASPLRVCPKRGFGTQSIHWARTQARIFHYLAVSFEGL